MKLCMYHFDCQACGACCAFFRVSFYWGETDVHSEGQVPQALTTAISPHLVAMRGTTIKSPRCVALNGEIGQSVACSIYAQRSSTCRAFAMGTDECLKARTAHGLTNSHQAD